METGLLKLSTRYEFNDVLDSVGYHCGRYTRQFVERRILKNEAYSRDKFWYDDIKRRWRKDARKEEFLREFRDKLSDRICRSLNYEEQHRMIRGESDLMLCMSAVRDEHDKNVALDESLLWGHYADGGRGMRIGIEFDESFDDFLYEMKYSRKMTVCNLHQYKPQMTPDDMKRIGHAFRLAAVTTKSAAWEYEHEVRLILADKDPFLTSRNGITFFPFKKASIWRVDFGPLCFVNEPAFVRKVQQLRNAGYDNTLFRMAGVDPDLYGYRYLTEHYLRSGVASASACGHPNSFIFPPCTYDEEPPIGSPCVTYC